MPKEFPKITINLNARLADCRIVIEVSDSSKASLTVGDCDRYVKALRNVIDGSSRERVETDNGTKIEFARFQREITLSIVGQASCKLTLRGAEKHLDEIVSSKDEAERQ